jgi:hypothetical protein
MKNSTKVRLHLSKKLFESLTREIIKEAKANDGYTVAVKQPKAPKQVKEVNAVADTDKMEKMEEKMSSKEKMAKGLYNEVDAEMDTDKMKKMEEMEMNVAEEGQVREFAEEGQQLITALATLLGIGVPLATSIYKDLKNAKTPEAKKQVMQSLGKSVGSAAGAHLQKSQATPSLNELRKQVKK